MDRAQPTGILTPVLLGLALFTFATCDSTSSRPELSAEASSYLTAALDSMEAHHIDRKEVNWSSFRANVRTRAEGADTPRDTYNAIRFALDRLDDHSSFEPPSKSPSRDRRDSPNTSVPLTTRLPAPLSTQLREKQRIEGFRFGSTVGYINLPDFSGDEQAAPPFAEEIQNTIQRVDSTTVCGWIVDLRENPGGNMWPMIAGIGPVVGEGHLGSFVYPDADTLKWFYEDGASVYGDQPVVSVPGASYELRRSSPPVAVLIGGRTASSGEAVAVAFQGRDQTRTFGRPTYGVPTAIAPFSLRDGAELFLAVAAFADRTGTTYRSSIVPDVRAAPPPPNEPTPNDDIVGTARQWILEQPYCH